MQIELQNLMPTPLASISHGAESIWGNNIVLENGKKILLNASSGKGKSTFTTTIFGLRNDYAGNLIFDQKNTKNLSVSDWTEIRKSKISVIFQDLQLFPSLTVEENLNLKNDLTNTFTKEELRNFLTVLDIESKWNQKCGLLSMGQQQRVAIIRALAQPFEWLIMDEPFSHLDEENTQKALKLIKERCEQINAGFVLTTLGDTHQFNYDYELKL